MLLTASGIIVNRQLTSLAQLSEVQLLARVANLEFIRTYHASVSLLVDSKETMTRLEQLYTAVHTEELTTGLTSFPLSPNWIPFVVELPPTLHYWLGAHSLPRLRAQVVNWLAALYAAHCHRFQLWPKLLPEIRQWASKHYAPYNRHRATELPEVWAREFDQTQRLVGGESPGVLLNPLQDTGRSFLNDEAVRASYQFDVCIGYFRQDDWLLIVERSRPKIRAYYQSNLQAGVWTERTIDELLRRGALDNMARQEADRSLWQAWQRHFPTAEWPTQPLPA